MLCRVDRERTRRKRGPVPPDDEERRHEQGDRGHHRDRGHPRGPRGNRFSHWPGAWWPGAHPTSLVMGWARIHRLVIVYIPIRTTMGSWLTTPRLAVRNPPPPPT